MYRKSHRLILCSLAVTTLLLAGACVADPSEQDSLSNTTETMEIEMDPQTARDAQMLLDAFPDGDYYEEQVFFAAISLRENGIEPFVSIERVDDEEISDLDRKLHVEFMLDIVDDTDTRYRVGFSRSGLASLIYLPPDYTEMIDVPPPPVF